MHRDSQHVLDRRSSRHRAELSLARGLSRYNSTRIANEPGGYGFNNVYSAEMSVNTLLSPIVKRPR